MIKISEKKQTEIDVVYEALKERLTWLGNISLNDAFKYCQENFQLKDVPYHKFRKAFGLVMLALIDQGKVKRTASGKYEIIRVGGSFKTSISGKGIFKFQNL